ncbi:hypothetical protein TDB9533_02533 [Thalassocella blandensis]|nr:hypothetical protein TDB9533_02533 [Thalassocella blandensis]
MSEINKKIHEIRNPLNTISMNAELGKLSLQKTGDIEKAMKAFDVIINECQTCGLALADLKEFVGEKNTD